MTSKINSSSLCIVPDSICHLILFPVMQTPPAMWWWKVLIVATIGTARAASREKWLGRSVYQVVTDRFARSDNSTSASCNAGLGEYCGGSFRGLINRLGYIQDLGFDAVWISPVQSQESTRTADLSGIFHSLVGEFSELNTDAPQPIMVIGPTTCILSTLILALPMTSRRCPQRCTRVAW